MSDTVKLANCPRCGSALPGGVLGELCPACLMNQATETQSREGRETRFVPPSVGEIGKIFPQLTVLELLGSGGMGAVYKARQPALDRLVAVKILPPTVAGGINFSERFNREARALARLSHPNIVAVHEFGQAGGLNYFIMEFVDGTNLRQLTRNTRISPREALQIIPQICEALQYAHDEGVVHRDIKPENVLVDRKGRVKIADFGIARILDADPEKHRLTVEGQVIGTPHYMAPEQLERPLAADHRADIYSLGVVFYELLTGDLPLGKFPPPSRKVSVDVRLDEVVLRALENDPARRYQQVSQVQTELKSISESPAAHGNTQTTSVLAADRGVRYVRSAPFAVAVDRNGDREIRWNGAVGLIGTAFLLMALALLIFRFIAGYHFSGSLGVPILITLAVTGAALRWALNAPESAAEPAEEDAEGDLVFPESEGIRWNRGHLYLAGVLPLVLTWLFLQQFGIPAIRARITGSRAVAQSASLHPERGVLAANLPGRGQVEVVAVSYPDAAPQAWWRPAGWVITNRTYEIENPPAASMTGRTNRDLIVRLSDLPSETDGPFFEVDPQHGYASGGAVLNGGRLDTKLWPVRFAVDPGLRSLDFRIGFGLEPWRTVAVRQARAQTTSAVSVPGGPHWDIQFHDVADTSEGVQVTLIAPREDRNWRMRLVGVDINGAPHFYHQGRQSLNEDRSTWTYKFHGLALDQTREFQIQARPVHWIAFNDVALYPDTPVLAGRPRAFTSARQIAFDTFIDFDSGLTRDQPAMTNAHVLDISGTLAWMESEGLDAAAANGGLQPLGMIFVALENETWDTIAPRDLVLRLHSGQFRPPLLQPWKSGQLPSTFGFRTREGGTGILQLLELPEDRPGVVLQYKLVQDHELE